MATYTKNKQIVIPQGKSQTTSIYTRSNGRKFVSTNRPSGDKAEHEIQILRELAGLPGIIPLEHFEKNGKFIKIYTPYFKNGDLHTFLTNNDISDKLLLDIFKQIIETVTILHSSNICHLDLKLKNIVIDENYKIYIIDFESAINFDDEKETIIKVENNGRFLLNREFGTLKYLPSNVKKIFNNTQKKISIISQHYSLENEQNYKKIIKELIKSKKKIVNGYALDMYAVYMIMKNMVEMVELKRKIREDIKLLLDQLLKFIEEQYKNAKSDLSIQTQIYEKIEEMIAILEQPTEGGYKKPRRKIHKQYTRKRRINKS